MFDHHGNRKYLNKAERKVFLRVVKAERNRSFRGFLLVLFYSGCRISEGLNVTTERFDVIGKAIVFETLKRRKRGHFRSVPIPDDLIALLAMLASDLKPSERIWKFSRTTGYRMVKRKLARAGITGTKASPKGLRHGFAIACLEQRVPLTIVQKWLGHARMETTAIYLEASGNEEREMAKRLWRLR